jgi:hypothetical protein
MLDFSSDWEERILFTNLIGASQHVTALIMAAQI